MYLVKVIETDTFDITLYTAVYRHDIPADLCIVRPLDFAQMKEMTAHPKNSCGGNHKDKRGSNVLLYIAHIDILFFCYSVPVTYNNR